jgi:hypothetical protein
MHKKLALTSPTSGGRSAGIVRSRTEFTELCYERHRLWLLKRRLNLDVKFLHQTCSDGIARYYEILLGSFPLEANSVQWPGYLLDYRSSIPHGETNIFVCYRVYTGSNVHVVLYMKGTGLLSLWVRWPEPELDHSPPSSVEVKTTFKCTLFLQVSSWYALK